MNTDKIWITNRCIYSKSRDTFTLYHICSKSSSDLLGYSDLDDD